MGVSISGGTPKSSILIRVSLITHPLWGNAIYGNPHIWIVPAKIDQDALLAATCSWHGISSPGDISRVVRFLAAIVGDVQ